MGSAFRKHSVPAEGLCSLHRIISKCLLKFFMCCCGTATDFNTQKIKDGIPQCVVPCFHFHGEVHKHLLTCQAPTPQWFIAQSCHCKWGWRNDQGQSLSVLADCSIAYRARRKLISLLYCRTSYSTESFNTTSYVSSTLLILPSI